MDFGQNVLGNPNSGDSSRLVFKMRHVVLDLQETFTVIEKVFYITARKHGLKLKAIKTKEKSYTCICK